MVVDAKGHLQGGGVGGRGGAGAGRSWAVSHLILGR